MKIVVEMTSDEFEEFMAWKADAHRYRRDVESLSRKYSFCVSRVPLAVEPDPKKPGKYKIADQDHTADLYECALDLLE